MHNTDAGKGDRARYLSKTEYKEFLYVFAKNRQKWKFTQRIPVPPPPKLGTGYPLGFYN